MEKVVNHWSKGSERPPGANWDEAGEALILQTPGDLSRVYSEKWGDRVCFRNTPSVAVRTMGLSRKRESGRENRQRLLK